MIDQITDFLFIGKARHASTPDLLSQHNITAVVKLHESPPDWSHAPILLDFPIDDGVFHPTEVFQKTDAFIREQVAQGNRVLVICGAGISRSATVLLSALIDSGMDAKEAFSLLRSNHPQSDPHVELWKSLIAHHRLPYSLIEVLRW